jgi:hypothetical protein
MTKGLNECLLKNSVHANECDDRVEHYATIVNESTSASRILNEGKELGSDKKIPTRAA